MSSTTAAPSTTTPRRAGRITPSERRAMQEAALEGLLARMDEDRKTREDALKWRMHQQDAARRAETAPIGYGWYAGTTTDGKQQVFLDPREWFVAGLIPRPELAFDGATDQERIATETRFSFLHNTFPLPPHLPSSLESGRSGGGAWPALVIGAVTDQLDIFTLRDECHTIIATFTLSPNAGQWYRVCERTIEID